jgi:phage terminase Nu1 subunit (DNA packaging protein)
MTGDRTANADRTPERYVGRRELADLMGVNVRTVDRMVRDGMPSENWGLWARRFRPSLALAWARTREARGNERRSAA